MVKSVTMGARDVVQMARTSGWGSEGREFKSRRPDFARYSLWRKRASIYEISLCQLGTTPYPYPLPYRKNPEKEHKT